MPSLIKGSHEWGKKIIKQAQELSLNITLNYVELSKILYEINNTNVDGNPTNPPVYTEWGYTKYETFALEVLGLEARKANYLKSIGSIYQNELIRVDPEWVDRFFRLGWSKVREICRVLKADQIIDWVIQAEQATFKEVQMMVNKYLDKVATLTEERSAAIGTPFLSKDPFSPPKREDIESDGIDDELNTVSTGAELSDIVATAPDLSSMKPVQSSKPVRITEGVAVPSPERLITETFSLYEEQHKTVKKALTKAEQLSGSNKKSYNLELICSDFMMSNNFDSASEEQKLKYLARVERFLGYKLVAAHSDNNEIVYGLNNLTEIAKTQISLEQEVVCSR